MAQRHSEYERIDGDLYVTPRWVYEALYEVEPWAMDAWDCAPINHVEDFLGTTCITKDGDKHIATNPPFSLAEKFVRHALHLTRPTRPDHHHGKVAMLLPMAWDTAKGRTDLFRGRTFKAKYTLTKRIRWENLEQKKNGPSSNHAWFVWDWRNHNLPTMGWLPLEEAA